MLHSRDEGLGCGDLVLVGAPAASSQSLPASQDTGDFIKHYERSPMLCNKMVSCSHQLFLVVINVSSCRRNIDRKVKPWPGENWASKELLISPCLRNLVKASDRVLLEIGNSPYKHVPSYVTAKLIIPSWATTPFYRTSLCPKRIAAWHRLLHAL